MSTRKKAEKKANLWAYLKSKLMLRLWAGNMLLAAIAILFLWVVQILLFEPNYVNTTREELFTRVQTNAVELEYVEQIDPYNSNNPLHFLSKMVIGTVFLVDRNGEILFAYNGGRMNNPVGMEGPYAWLINHYADVIAGNTYTDVVQLSSSRAITAGVPAIYQDEPVAILLYHSMTQIYAMQRLNRQQLLTLSIILTLVASLISFILARHFSRPIQNIKGTVKRLTQGDLTAVPQVRRSDELGELSDSVEELGQELQRVDVLRKEVISNISHELRAPLALITGYSEMVRDVTGPDEAQRNRNMDIIISEANRLSEMVDDIMDYSQMQAGYSELKLELCNLFDLVESAVGYGREAARQYHIGMLLESYSRNIPMRLDALKISQVLRNLLNNAINHTENGRTIEVGITKNETAVCVAVTNPGEEIPPEQLDEIWERYRRVQHQGGHREGTGIGLAIVSTILTAHNMDYGVESGNGVNCFWFSAANERIEDDGK
ncbi:HAMP domain-containing histidine kinase [Brucepastera parasyntrophica]|uniref:sensor histidine kinase n=1 Tax=Brucepastera parasyntrophica TaxID=2880008 RepID=UPI002108DE6D|nr:HAMP domain-containing sensor histidine kinase [Brucepastera parasyntrophica]ULQ58481.1 HAMP domain-containing histidine kinase [Brucepastera parasyntrophica]